MRSRTFLALLFGCLLLAVIGIEGPRYLKQKAHRDVEAIRSVLKGEVDQQIPIGSQPERVLEFLNSRKIQHSGYELADDDQVALAVLGAPAIIEARIKINTVSLYDYSIHMVFKFDKSGRFISFRHCRRHSSITTLKARWVAQA